MNGKKVTFGTKPRPAPTVKDADAWVSGRETLSLDTQTLPIDTQGDEAGHKVNDANIALEKKEDETTERILPTQAKTDKESIKRLTIDIPEELHRRVKSGCALRGEKIADVVRELLEQRFPTD
jgi:ParG